MKDKISKIEDLNIGADHKAVLVLVLLDLKPACEIDIYESAISFSEIKDALHFIGLSVVKRDICPWDDLREDLRNDGLDCPTMTIAVSKESEVARQLLVCSSVCDHETYGRLMGYPERAIQSFLRKVEGMGFREFSKLKNKHRLIFSFRVPKEGYDECLEVLNDWSRAIEELAPNVFEELKSVCQIPKEDEILGVEKREREYLSVI